MIISVNLSHAEGDTWWSGNLVLDDPASFHQIQIDDQITLELGGETFFLIVDNKTLERDEVNMPQFTVAVVSPTARFATPRATPMERIWDVPVLAKEAAESAVGEAIQWDLVDWQILGGRLAVHNAAPIDVVKTITEAAGGVVETLPAGMLLVRHRFPVAVPDWTTATPDHVLTDAADNLSCQESHVSRRRVNRVSVRGYLPQVGYLSVSVDDRPNGPNQGRTTFGGGETAHLLVYSGQDVTGITMRTSLGELIPGPPQTVDRTQDVVFNGTATTATLDQPASEIVSVLWIGADLGTLTLETDRRTITIQQPGMSTARVAYRAIATSWRLTLPTTTSNLETFSAQVRVDGQTGLLGMDGEIICQRGPGDHPGDDISDPLLANTQAKISRGRAEIDAGEVLQEVSLTCLHRPNFLPGQLAEVHDALMGQSWRGKITSVSHAAQGPKLTTTLGLQRYVPTTR